MKPRKIRISFHEEHPYLRAYDIANDEDVTNQTFNFRFPADSHKACIELYAHDEEGKKFIPGDRCQIAKEKPAEVVEISGTWRIKR